MLEAGFPGHADVAQLVEHFTRNEGVPGSIPGVGFPWIHAGFAGSPRVAPPEAPARTFRERLRARPGRRSRLLDARRLAGELREARARTRRASSSGAWLELVRDLERSDRPSAIRRDANESRRSPPPRPFVIPKADWEEERIEREAAKRDGVRAPSCRNLTRIDVVPMQGIDARRAAWRFASRPLRES